MRMLQLMIGVEVRKVTNNELLDPRWILYPFPFRTLQSFNSINTVPNNGVGMKISHISITILYRVSA